MKNFLIAIVLIAIVVVVGIVLFNNTPESALDGAQEDDTSGMADNETEEDPLDNFTVYENDELGFLVSVPEAAIVDSPIENRVRIRVIGPASEEGSEITEGFTFTVFNDPEANEYETLEAYAEAVYARTSTPAAGEPLTELEEESVSGMDAYSYRYETALGTEATSYIFMPTAGEGYVVTYTIGGVNAETFEAAVLTMLESIQFEE